MLFADLGFNSPQENLACDEVLLDRCEHEGGAGVLRTWESAEHFVVVGYANQVRTEVHVEECERLGIPVFRRCSGGGTVLQGPGCLNYAVVLPLALHPALESITRSNQWILNRVRKAVAHVTGSEVEIRGHTDLVINGLKFAGNAQRRRKHYLLFHGSLLLNADIGLIEQVLPMPSKEPDYRGRRPHRDFLVNLGVSAEVVKAELAREWNVGSDSYEVPEDEVQKLARERYSSPDWNWKF